ncbi:MAG: tetratricopeptide repeat protein [Terracidiphilus sp.]|nr:tetratricopeptide repeat protein [Terracidiphilus sp.]
MLRLSVFMLLLASLAGSAQEPAQKPEAPTPAPGAVAGPQAVSGQVDGAEAAIAKSDWKAAEAALDLWLAGHPSDARALFDAGYVADAQNRSADAAGLYRRALSADPNSFEAHLSLGLLLARQGRADEARPELALATTLDPGEAGAQVKASAWRALARIDSVSHPEDASNELLEALKLSPETTADTLLAAGIADQAGEYAAAETAYRRVLATAPEAASAGLAHVLIALKRYPEAETLLRGALDKSPDDPVITAELATVLADQDKAEALPLLEKLHDAHPQDAAMTHMLAAVLADAGDFVGSDHLYAGLLAASPNDAALLIAHGQNLIRQIRYQEAFAAFTKATQLNPADADGWSGLAFAASRTGHPEVTLHALTMRSKYLPEVASTYFLWATAYDTLHQKPQAAAYYQHFLDSSAGKFPDQEWQARQRLKLLSQKP